MRNARSQDRVPRSSLYLKLSKFAASQKQPEKTWYPRTQLTEIYQYRIVFQKLLEKGAPYLLVRQKLKMHRSNKIWMNSDHWSAFKCRIESTLNESHGIRQTSILGFAVHSKILKHALLTFNNIQDPSNVLQDTSNKIHNLLTGHLFRSPTGFFEFNWAWKL